MKTVIRGALAVGFVAAFAVAGLVGTDALLERLDAAEASETASGSRSVRVGIAQPQTRRIEEAVSSVGTVTPSRDVDIRPIVAGRVSEVPVGSGQSVEQGDLILQLDDRAQRARLKGAKATLQEARQNLNRIAELAQDNTAAEQRLEAARATFARAESEAMAAEAALEDRRIEAPFDGTLGLVDLDPGAYIDPQEVVVTLSDLSTVQVDVALPERYFDRVTPGQTIDVSVPAYPDRTFEGKVVVREPVVDERSRSFDVRARIENTERTLVGGMFAQTRLVVEVGEGLAVPDDAIIAEGSDTYVYTVTDGTAQRRDVTPGQSLGPLTEIASELTPNDRVVVSGWNTLRDGAPVTVAEDIAREGLE